MDGYDIARQITNEVFGEGAYEEINKGNPDPGVQAAIKRTPQKYQHKTTPEEFQERMNELHPDDRPKRPKGQ